MNEKADELPEGPLPSEAVRSFSESIGEIQTIARDKLGIDLASPRLSGSRHLEAFLQDFQGRFGGTLLAVFRFGLYARERVVEAQKKRPRYADTNSYGRKSSSTRGTANRTGTNRFPSPRPGPEKGPE